MGIFLDHDRTGALAVRARATTGEVKMASLLYAAKWLRNAVCHGGETKPMLPDQLLMQPLGLTPAMFSSIATEVRARFQEASVLLDGVNEDGAATDRRCALPTAR